MLVAVPAGIIASSVWLMGDALHTRSEAEPVRGWTETTGTITSAPYTRDGHGGIYAPVITFTAGGQPVTFSAPTSSDQPAIGAKVPVDYDPADPQAAHDLADTAWQAPFYSGLFTLIPGVAVTVFEVCLVTSLLRKRARRRRQGLVAVG